MNVSSFKFLKKLKAGVFEGYEGLANMLWPDFTYQWPLMINPDPKTFPGPSEVISA